MEPLMKQRAEPAFDEDGFLSDPALWSTQLAEDTARADGIGNLSEGHWAIIQLLRDHYLNFGALMPTSHLCRVSKQHPQCVSELFRSMAEAWRIAGLPNPGEEAKSYMH